MFDPNDLSPNESEVTINPEGEELNEAEQNLVSGGGGIYGSSDGDGS